MGILTRNWQIKLGAVALATVLYTGLVFSGSFTEDTWRGLPVRLVEQGNSYLVSPAQPPTIDVRYRASRDTAAVSADVFVATVDLSRYDLEQVGVPQVLPIEVRSLSPGVTAESWEPSTVSVVLDVVDQRSVPVIVDPGEVPDGLEIGRVTASLDEAEVRGPRSNVQQVDRAVARVRIDPSGLDFERAVTLEAVDVNGQRVENVEVTPQSVEVQIPVRAVETNKTVPIRPNITGTPAAGFAIASISIEPSVVTVRGFPDVLDPIAEVTTEAMSIAAAEQDVAFTVQLALPEGTRLADDDAEISVEVVVTVAPTVQSRTYLVGLACQGEPAGTACLPGVEQLSLTVSGTGAVLGALQTGQLTAVLDVAGLPPGQHSVTPTFTGLPEGVSVVSSSPASVSVTLVPPATPAPTPTPQP